MRRRIPAPLGRTSALGDAASKRPAPAEVRLVVAQGMRLALLGLAIGLAAAFLATRLMAKLL
jgi:hypothetical protein